MKINRRELMALGAMGAAALTTRVSAGAEEKEESNGAVLKVASQEGRIPGKDLPEKLANMEKWGLVGIEIGGRGLADRVNEIQSALANSSVKMTAICAGFQGALTHSDEEERKKAVTSMKEILTAAGELGSTGLIFVPAFNGQSPLPLVEGRQALMDQLPELGDHAVKCGTRLLMEPLNRREAWFLRMLADAASICRDVNHPGVAMMGDFYHMYTEETSDMGAFLSAGKYCRHVHLASIKRNLPGQDERDFTDGFRGLKMIGYQDYCSFECGILGDPMVEIPKSVKFLHDQWEKA